jgi:acarbose 7IV-phosphotransferase
MLGELMNRYPCRLIACGQGADGALLAIRSGAGWRWHHQCAIATRPVVNTVGAGDALFSSFNHFLANGCAVEEALRFAAIFASWKIGATGAAEGFLTEQEVRQIEHPPPA